MAGERSVKDTEMVKSRFLEYIRNNTRSVDDRTEVGQEEED